ALVLSFVVGVAPAGPPGVKKQPKRRCSPHSKPPAAPLFAGRRLLLGATRRTFTMSPRVAAPPRTSCSRERIPHVSPPAPALPAAVVRRRRRPGAPVRPAPRPGQPRPAPRRRAHLRPADTQHRHAGVGGVCPARGT